jgi:hypothetical protein
MIRDYGNKLLPLLLSTPAIQHGARSIRGTFQRLHGLAAGDTKDEGQLQNCSAGLQIQGSWPRSGHVYCRLILLRVS